MIINLTQGEKCQATLTVEIPAEFVSAAREGVTTQYLSQAKVPGYRPGKVPRTLIEKRFSAGIRSELEKKLGEDAMREAKKKEELSILAVLSRDLTPNVDETYTMRAELIVAPSFQLPEYKGIPITLPKEEVKEEHLERLLERWKDQNADYSEIEDKGLEMGQYAVIDFKATLDGEPLVKEDSPALYRGFFQRDDAWMWMDEEAFFPGFCGELLDHKKGDAFEFKLTLPADFGEEDLRGKEVTYAVTLKQIMSKDQPELTDEKVEETSRGEFKTVEEFKTDLRERLEKEMEQHVESIRTKVALDYLLGLVDFDLPESMVERETQGHVDRIFSSGQQRGLDASELVEKEDEIVEAASFLGRRDLKAKFILNQIATAEGLKVTEQEMVYRIRMIASRARMSPKKAIRILRGNGQMNLIAEEILFSKSLDFVKQNANIAVDESRNALDEMWDGDPSA